MLFGLLASGRGPDAPAARWAGGVIGALSVWVGIWGTILHIQSAFFRRFALDGLVYAAPFVAPLAYAGIGFLLLANRRSLFRPAADDFGWGRWVTMFAAGGFAGNFVLSLLDHEQNGFSFWTRVDSGGLGGTRGVEPRPRGIAAHPRAGTRPPRVSHAAGSGRSRPARLLANTSTPGSAPSADGLSRRSSTALRRSRRCCLSTWRCWRGPGCWPSPHRQRAGRSIRLRRAGDAAAVRRTGRSDPAGDPEGVTGNPEVSTKTLMARYERSSAIVRPVSRATSLVRGSPRARQMK